LQQGTPRAYILNCGASNCRSLHRLLPLALRNVHDHPLEQVPRLDPNRSRHVPRRWAPGQAREPGWPTVKLRYLRTYLGDPLTIERLQAEKPDISGLLLNGFQAASFPIPADDFRAVLALLGEKADSLPHL
jgi:hypothetical protein